MNSETNHEGVKKSADIKQNIENTDVDTSALIDSEEEIEGDNIIDMDAINSDSSELKSAVPKYSQTREHNTPSEPKDSIYPFGPKFPKKVMKSLRVATIVTIILTLSCFSAAVINAENTKIQMNTSIIRTTAGDGVPLKALLYSQPWMLSAENKSVPLIIICHGMSSHFWEYPNWAYTLTKYGYAVISPEFRGHQSNPAPATLGSKEPWDIITWLDWSDDNLNYIDTNHSGIFGVSMGGLYATSAFIFENMGKGRLKAVITYAGPVNVSRELEFFTSNSNALGDFPMMENITGKNPMTYLTADNPKNIMIVHGTEDKVVDFQCSVDLYNAIDPNHNRSDVVFYPLEGKGHGIGGIEEYLQKSMAWLDKYVKNQTTDPKSIKIYELDFSLYPASLFKIFLFFTAVSLILYAFYSVIFYKPEMFNEYQNKLNSLQRNEENDRTLLDVSSGRGIFILTLIFLFLQFLAGIVGNYIDGYLLNKLAISGIISFLYVTVLYMLASKRDRAKALSWINPKVGLIWFILATTIILTYMLIPGIPFIEDLILDAGIRITFWVGYFTLYTGIQLLSNVLFIRLVYLKKRKKYQRKLEPFINGLLVFAQILAFMYWGWGSPILIYIIGEKGAIAPLTAATFFVMYILFDYIIQSGEYLGKTIVSGSFLSGFLMANFIGASFLVFSY